MHFCWLFPYKLNTASVGPTNLYTFSISTSFLYIYSLRSHVNFFAVDILSPFNRWENRSSERHYQFLMVTEPVSNRARAWNWICLAPLAVCSPSHGEPQMSRAVLPLHQPFPDTARRSSWCCFLFPRHLLGVPVARVMNGVTGSEGTGSVIRQTWFECQLCFSVHVDSRQVQFIHWWMRVITMGSSQVWREGKRRAGRKQIWHIIWALNKRDRSWADGWINREGHRHSYRQ